MISHKINGFSKLSKQAKIDWLITNYTINPEESLNLLKNYCHQNEQIQKLHDEFIENTISNFYMPFGIAPNFLIDGQYKAIPMAIEESSVVAAASKAANFWADRGGFNTTIINTEKIGHIHFMWKGQSFNDLKLWFNTIKHTIIDNTNPITQNMRLRGGGILNIDLIDKTNLEPHYFQIEVKFETCDSMGANFINSCLEDIAKTIKNEIVISDLNEKQIQIVMCILSNYTPNCIVKSEVSCKIDDLNDDSGISNELFCEKFLRAVRIAEIEPYRAVTHNKGIMNGIDSVVIATGNDFRAIEACAHAYASRNGLYSSLTHAKVENNTFKFWIEIPLSLGTVGGITTLHPMVKFALQILGNPSSKDLMGIIASAGLAQNFSALRSLTTTGIQKGHMKMHLLNILNQYQATELEKSQIINYFKNDIPSHHKAVEIITRLRNGEVLSSN